MASDTALLVFLLKPVVIEMEVGKLMGTYRLLTQETCGNTNVINN